MAGTASFDDSGYPLLQSDYIDNIIGLLQISEDGSILEPKDLRDSNWTLWNKIEDLQILGSQSYLTLWDKIEDVEIMASQSSLYERLDPTLISVGGIPVGSTFSGVISDVLDRLLYPYVSQVNSLTISNSNREYGDDLLVDLNWSIVKKSNNLEEIIVSNVIITPLGGDQSGIETITSTYSLSPGFIETISYTMSSYDGVSSLTSSVNLNWMNRVYWGTIDLSSVGSTDLTMYPLMIGDISNYIDSSIILGLDNSILSTTMSATHVNFGGDGNYLCFAWPEIFGTPNFLVNSLVNNTFTKVKSDFPLVNQYGFSGVNYGVWISNIEYNSSVDIIIK
jgi:hypothetical protein